VRVKLLVASVYAAFRRGRASGFNVTSSIGAQFRVWRAQRVGFCSRASTYKRSRAAKISTSWPACRWAGVTSDTAVQMLVVVPVHERTGPLTRRFLVSEAAGRIRRAVLRGAEQRLDVSVVVGDTRPRVRRLDAEPMQQRETVVAFSVAPLSPCSTGLRGDSCSPSANTARFNSRAAWSASSFCEPPKPRSCGCTDR
jgi:hypothetical protein